MARENAWMMPAAGVGVAVLVAAIGTVLYVAWPGSGEEGKSSEPPRAEAPAEASGGAQPATSAGKTDDTAGVPMSGAIESAQQTPAPEPAQAASDVTSGDAMSETDQESGADTRDDAAEAEADLTETESLPTVSPPEPVPPVFDVVRVPAEGFATVAGRAEPGAEVSVLLDGVAIATTTASARGEFVTLFELVPAQIPREMRLSSKSGEVVVLSAETIIIAPASPIETPEEVSPSIAELEIDAAPEPTGETAAAGAEPGPADLPDTARSAASKMAEQVLDAAKDLRENTTDMAEAETGSPDIASSDTQTAQETDMAEADEAAAVEPGAVSGEENAATSENLASEAGDATRGDVVTDAGAQEAAEQATAAISPDETSEQSAAPTLLMADDEGLKVLQQDGSAPTDLRIDAVTYDPEGRVFASGRAAAGAQLRIYLDQDFLTQSVAGEDGQWRQELPNVAAGRYRLRVDHVDAAGKVLTRAEIPFQREDVAKLAQLAGLSDTAEEPSSEASSEAETAPAPKQADQADQADRGGATQTLDDSSDEASSDAAAQSTRIASVTVQPGNTLWGIATQRYGDGFLYVRVFDANRGQIRDPDLIYPGQIFTLPEE